MSSFSGSLTVLFATFVLQGALLAQTNWACADDGATIVVTNQGSSDQKYIFKMNAQAKYDSSLLIRVVTRDGQGVVIQVHSTFEWNYGTDPTITVGAGQSIEVSDPSDTDSKTGAGTYEAA